MRETRTEFLWLKGIYLDNLKEPYEKKFILKCAPELVTCSLNFRLMTNHEVGKYAMVIVPTLCQPHLIADQETMAMQAVIPQLPVPIDQVTT